MDVFRCECGNTLSIKNDKCLVCGRKVGYLPDIKKLSAIEVRSPTEWLGLESGRLYRKCENYNELALCNWMIPVEKKTRFCASCRNDAFYKRLYVGLVITIVSLIAAVYLVM